MTNTKDSPGNTNNPVQPTGNPIGKSSGELDEQVISPAPSPDKQGGVKQGGEPTRQTEHGGTKGLEPTRYGDWEHNSRCTDF